MVLLLAGMGILFFEESLSRTEIAGIALAVAALFLLARTG
jgi:multidrug transporter EmrE-like cation transporter